MKLLALLGLTGAEFLDPIRGSPAVTISLEMVRIPVEMIKRVVAAFPRMVAARRIQTLRELAVWCTLHRPRKTAPDCDVHRNEHPEHKALQGEGAS